MFIQNGLPALKCALLFVRIDQILHKAAVRHKTTVAADSPMPWTDVISACVDYQLSWLRYHKVFCCAFSLSH